MPGNLEDCFPERLQDFGLHGDPKEFSSKKPRSNGLDEPASQSEGKQAKTRLPFSGDYRQVEPSSRCPQRLYVGGADKRRWCLETEPRSA